MRAIHINAAARTVNEIDISGDLESLQKHVGGYIQVLPQNFVSDDIFVDEEGRLKTDTLYQRWHLVGWHEPYLCGSAVVIGATSSGDSAPATSSLEWIRSQVTFL